MKYLQGMMFLFLCGNAFATSRLSCTDSEYFLHVVYSISSGAYSYELSHDQQEISSGPISDFSTFLLKWPVAESSEKNSFSFMLHVENIGIFHGYASNLSGTLAVNNVVSDFSCDWVR